MCLLDQSHTSIPELCSGTLYPRNRAAAKPLSLSLEIDSLEQVQPWRGLAFTTHKGGVCACRCFRRPPLGDAHGAAAMVGIAARADHHPQDAHRVPAQVAKRRLPRLQGDLPSVIQE